VSDIDVLQDVLDKLEGLITGVRPDQLADPTCCPDYDVNTLVNHIVGWLQAFAEAANARKPEGDPSAFSSAEPGKAFHLAAEEVVAGWRAYGTERTVSLTGAGVPGAMVLSMTIMEYVAHGCDLAMATGQTVPFTDDELGVALARAQTSLPDQMRGDSFGPPVQVPDTAPVLDRFLGFMGRSTAAAA
jgi:uncharacterized protein (TIGR03086 family)